MVKVHCGEVHYRKGLGEWHLHPLDKLSEGVSQRDKSTSPCSLSLSPANNNGKKKNKHVGYHISMKALQKRSKSEISLTFMISGTEIYSEMKRIFFNMLYFFKIKHLHVQQLNLQRIYIFIFARNPDYFLD